MSRGHYVNPKVFHQLNEKFIDFANHLMERGFDIGDIALTFKHSAAVYSVYQCAECRFMKGENPAAAMSLHKKQDIKEHTDYFKMVFKDCYQDATNDSSAVLKGRQSH